MMTLVIVVPKLLITIVFWLGMLDIKNTKHVKKDRRRIIACSMAPNKSLGLVDVARLKKKEVG